MTTLEEKFNQEVWEILQKVKRAKFVTVGNGPVEYKFPSVVGIGIIPKERQKKILYKLQEWGVLRIRENPWEPPESNEYIFYLNLIQPKFNQIYTKFQKTCDLQTHLNNIQNKAYDNLKRKKDINDGLPKFSQVKKPFSTSKVTGGGMSKFWTDEMQFLNKLLEICTPKTTEVELWCPSSLAENDPDRAGFDNEITIEELEDAKVLISPKKETYITSQAKKIKMNVDYKNLLKRAEHLHDKTESWKGQALGKEKQKKELLSRLQNRFDKYANQEVFIYSEKILGSYRPENHNRPLGHSLDSPDPNRPDIKYRFMQTMRALEKKGHFVIEDVEFDFSAEPQTTEEARRRARYAIGTDHKPREFYPPEHCKVTLKVKRKTKYNQLIDEIKQSQKSSVDLQKRYQEAIKDIKSSKPKRKQLQKQIGQKANWSDDFIWQGKTFIFGQYGKRKFTSKITRKMFRALTKVKGNWVTVKKLKQISGKNENYVRPTLRQIDRSFDTKLKKYISISSTETDDLKPRPPDGVGAYRIKFTPNPQ